jgi:hypothetical protein
MPPTFATNPELFPDHPFRDAKPANDGNLYPYNSKLRLPPLWIDEDGVEIADMPKILYSDPPLLALYRAKAPAVCATSSRIRKFHPRGFAGGGRIIP